MTQPERSTSQKEQFGQRALLSIIPALVAILIAIPMIAYQSMFVTLGYVICAMALAAIVYGAVQFVKLKQVPSFPVTCPYCKLKNEFMAPVEADVRCEGCQRMVPIVDGRILQVWQVRCGYCNHLNFYSEKSTGLICENCNRVVPIATSDEGQAENQTFSHFTIQDDDRPFDLVLTGAGTKSEELVGCLQQMLALNRNQVRDMLDEVPVTLLTGVKRKKAELLKAQIESHHGQADAKPTSG